MQYQLTSPDVAPAQIAAYLNTKLAGVSSMLLLLSGGSNVEIAVAIRPLLELGGKRVMVGLIDERYGPVGHADSNWAKLVAAGFDFDGLDELPVLHDGLSIEAAAAGYATRYTAALEVHDLAVGLFGLGQDGHTAGILPHSAALNAAGFVTSYTGPDFERVTLTVPGINQLNAGLLVAFGESKHGQLKRLDEDLPVADQPAQALKELPEVVVYNDLKGIAQ